MQLNLAYPRHDARQPSRRRLLRYWQSSNLAMLKIRFNASVTHVFMYLFQKTLLLHESRPSNKEKRNTRKDRNCRATTNAPSLTIVIVVSRCVVMYKRKSQKGKQATIRVLKTLKHQCPHSSSFVSHCRSMIPVVPAAGTTPFPGGPVMTIGIGIGIRIGTRSVLVPVTSPPISRR